MTPKYEKLAAIFSGDKDVLIGKVDATEHGELAKRFVSQATWNVQWWMYNSILIIIKEENNH